MLGIMARTFKKDTSEDLRDFSVSPSSATIEVGNTAEFTITVSGGLDILTISAVSSDTDKATLSISDDKITVIGVAEGSATITVSSSFITKTVPLSITVKDAELELNEQRDKNKKLENKTSKGVK